MLSRDHSKNLSCLRFERWGYSDVLPPLRESMLQSIQQKLPKLRGRSGLLVDIQLNFAVWSYLPPPLPVPPLVVYWQNKSPSWLRDLAVRCNPFSASRAKFV